MRLDCAGNAPSASEDEVRFPEQSGTPRFWRRALWLILLAALLLQLLMAALGLPPKARLLVGDEHMYLDLAQNWSRGGDKPIDPFWPPGYSWIFSRWIALTGSEAGFLIVQLGAFLVAVLLLARVALAVLGDEVAAAITAGLFGCSPQVASFAQYYWPEALHLAAGLAVFYVALIRRPTLVSSAMLGALVALALVLKGLLLPVVPALIVAHALRTRGPRRLLLASTSIVTAGVLLAPIVVSNYRNHGLLAVSDSSAFNLILGLTETERRSLADRSPRDLQIEYLGAAKSTTERRAWLKRRLNEELAGLKPIRQLGVQMRRQYFRLFDRESVFSAMLPGGSLHNRGRGYREPPLRLARLLVLADWLIYGLLLAIGPWGCAAVAQRNPRAGAWLAGWFCYLIGILLFHHVDVRYRLVLIPVLAIGAGAALARFWGRHELSNLPSLRPGPHWASVGIGCLLVYLGFALP